MLRRNLLNNSKAQTFLEYSAVLGIVTALLFAMNPLIKRTTQGMLKVVIDQVGIQENADQDFEGGGYLASSYTSVQTRSSEQIQDSEGQIVTDIDEETITFSRSNTHLGYQ